MSKKKIMITVDVEAQPRRAQTDPIDRLIWGKYPQGQAGIGEMMSIAESHDARLTMFLDYCERDIHGDLIMDVGREIHRRGHDLQLHAHPDFMSNDYWSEKGAPRILNLNETTPEQADILAEFLVAEHKRCTGEPPVGYRGGGYRFNQHLLNAFAKRGVLFQSSYNPPRKTQPLKFEFAKQFKWSNDCVEVPISCVKKYKNLSYPLEFNFNVGALSDVNRMTTFLDLFHREFGDDAIAVLVMHSWSLLEFDRESGFFTRPAPKNAKKLDKFLKAIRKTHDVVTATDVLALARGNHLVLDPMLDLAIFQNNDASSKPDQEEKKNMDMVDDNTDTGMTELLEKAEQLWNDPQADLDKTASVTLFRKAWDMGDRATAGYRLGSAHYDGIGAKKDIAKAYEYFSSPELDSSRYALFYRGRILKSNGFFGQNKAKAWEALNKALEMGVDLAAEEMKGLPVPSLEPIKKECPICGADGARFEKLKGRQCPDCGSVERQRVFALAYDKEIAKDFDIAGKHGLVISPSVSERRFFESRGVGQITSVDVRPEAKADIIADICAMPQVKSDRYDFVYASYVFTCVHDLDAAFREIARILKPGGCLISIDHLAFGAETREFTDKDKITSWYGDENYEKYKVGSFRALGEKGLTTQLSKYFNVRTYRATDPVTDLEMAVVVSGRETCAICNTPLIGLDAENETCIGCEGRARQRSLVPIMQNHIMPIIKDRKIASKLLVFAPNSTELKVLSNSYTDIIAASLYGKYGEGSYTGVDVRNMAVFEDGSFDDLTSICLFDYFIESKKALEECFRVMRAGGVFYTHIASFRLVPGQQSPKYLGVFVSPTSGMKEKIDSIEVGIDWFVTAMKEVGFDAKHVAIQDTATGIICDWFIGVKPESTIPTKQQVEHWKNNVLHQNEYKAFDTPYNDYKKNNPEASYSQFVMQREFDRVKAGKIEHASLGPNISQHGLDAAPLVIDFYRETLGLTENSKIVEYGCGSLRLARYFIEYLESGNYLGFDVVDGFFRNAKKIVEKKLAEKKTFDCHVINEVGIIKGEQFQADIVFSNSVAYHVHPDDIEDYFSNLRRLSAIPGSKLIFDAKLSDKPIRYSKNGWAWPLEFYKAMLAPLEFITLHREAPYAPAPGTTIAHLEFRQPVETCTICGNELVGLDEKNEACDKCGSRARTRTLPRIINDAVLPNIPKDSLRNKPLLGFAMSGAERETLNKTFSSVTSASLYGDYGSGHELGVDVRDLSRYKDNSFCGIMGILLFDYFTEHDKAMAECYRILASDGVLFTQIAPYRLNEGMERPEVAAIIEKKEGYFEYIPDDVDLVSIKVGHEWFMKAMKRAGFEVQHFRYDDDPSGVHSDWYVGTKKPTMAGTQDKDKVRGLSSSIKGRQDKITSSTTGFISGITGTTQLNRAEKILERNINKGKAIISAPASPTAPIIPQKEYSVPMPPYEETGYERVVVRLSAVPLPAEVSNSDFAEHVMDVTTGNATDTVIMCGIGFVAVSDDLGQSWRRIDVPGAKDIRLWNSFTTASGNHLIQSIGWQGPSDKVTDPEKHGAIFVFSKDWNFLKRVQPSNAYWHGTASIDQAADTIIYAEYHNNSARYASDFEQNKEKYIKDLRPCKVWRSRDDGVSWEQVFEQSPLEVRHFHTVVADPFQPQCWWLSSGDLEHETRVWRSDDDGDSWVDVTNPLPDVPFPPSLFERRQKCQRYTDVVVGRDFLLWGADDAVGFNDTDLDHTVALENLPGARMYMTPKTDPLQPKDIGYIGNHIRKLVDVGLGWIVITEASVTRIGYRPTVFLMMKDSFKLVRLFDVDNYINRKTVFTFSKGSSKATQDGTFFTYRTGYDALPKDYTRILRWDVEFIKKD